MNKFEKTRKFLDNITGGYNNLEIYDFITS